MIIADAFVDLAAIADTTVPTALNVAPTVRGSVTSVTINGVAAGMTVESPAGHRRVTSVCVPGYASGPSAATKAFKYLHTTASQSGVVFNFDSNNIGKVTAFGEITFGPANAGASSSIFDLVRFDTAWLGRFAVLQLNNGDGLTPGDYHVNIETAPGNGAGGTTTMHSQHLRVAQNVPYWFCLHIDAGYRPGLTQNSTLCDTGCARLALLHPYTGQLLGSAYAPVMNYTTATKDVCDGVVSCRIGNAEVGLSAGANTYFKHIGFDYKGRFPIGPRDVLQNARVPACLAVAAGSSAPFITDLNSRFYSYLRAASGNNRDLATNLAKKFDTLSGDANNRWKTILTAANTSMGG